MLAIDYVLRWIQTYSTSLSGHLALPSRSLDRYNTIRAGRPSHRRTSHFVSSAPTNRPRRLPPPASKAQPILSACLRIPQPVKYSTMMSPPSVAALQSSSSVAAKKEMTPAQARSLTAMRACLTCHLCDKRFTEPATLMACMHSFCHSCILEYTEDNWYCPGELRFHAESSFRIN